MLFFCLIVIAGFALYVMTPAERQRLVGRALPAVLGAKDAAVQLHADNDEFHDALRARTPWPVVTPALLVLNLAVFVGMLFGDGALGDPQTLLAWGGSYAPRTTNGEWWRLVSSLFVHSGFLHLIANAAGLVVVGILLERLVGHFAFATVYVAAGLFATLASVSDNPMTVTVGASGAVFGVYGLLAASAIWGLFKRSLAISLLALKKIAPGAAVFLLYHLATGRVDTAAINGLAIGFMGGLVLAWGVHERKPPAVRIAATFATTVVAVVAFAVPLRGFIDVKPALGELVAFEDRTAGAYEKALEQFRLGAMAAEALAQVIHRTILPDLAAMRERVATLDTAPAEHQPLVASAKEYLRLRDESWRLRAEGLQSHNMLTLRKADRAERASLDALEAFRPSVDR